MTQINDRQKSALIRSNRLTQVAYSELLTSTKLRGKAAIDASVIMHTPNTTNIAKFMVVMSFAMMASQSGTYMNVCTPLLTAQYEWSDTEETLNKALMNTIPAVGTIFGSGFGSVLMGKGRARALIIGCLVGIFGSAFTLIKVWSVFLCAKFVVGASIGMTGVVVARFIEEYVPLKWFGTSQAISLAFL